MDHELRRIECACGCGQTIPIKPHHKYDPPRYLQHHQMRGRNRTTKPPSDWPRPSGWCECGCGQRTPLARSTSLKRNIYRGHPLRFIHGHHTRLMKGPTAGGWKGGERQKTSKGYWTVYAPTHPDANRAGRVMEHRLIWEQTHGVRLQPRQDVHHIDGNKDNNAPENLVAITHGEHSSIHHSEQRMRGLNRTHHDESRINACRKATQTSEYLALQSERMKRWWRERRHNKTT